MNNHEIDYELHGDDMQFVEVERDPQETVIAEAGSLMNYIICSAVTEADEAKLHSLGMLFPPLNVS